MTKQLRTIGLLILLASSVSFAQVPATADVLMDVHGSLWLTKVRDLSLGYVFQGATNVQVDPITGGDQAAYFEFVTNPDLSVNVSFSSSDLTDGTHSISFTGALAGSTSSNQKDASLLTSGRHIIASSDGNYYFWAGGSAQLSDTQPFGVYQGSFTLSIAY